MNVQSLSASVAGDSAWMRNEARDKVESLLTSIPGGHSSEYGKKISGYAEFLNDEKVQKMVSNYTAPAELRGSDQEYDELYKTMTDDQKHAFWELTRSHNADRDRLHQDRENKLLAGVQTVAAGNADGASTPDLPRVSQAYGIPHVSRPAGADHDAAVEFETALQNGVEHMQIVDREFKTGVSTVTWEGRFRNVVESLDRAYRGMLGTAPGGSSAAANITRRYESKLGELFDYAIARSAS
jgi:hypothetical protein